MAFSWRRPNSRRVRARAGRGQERRAGGRSAGGFLGFTGVEPRQSVVGEIGAAVAPAGVVGVVKRTSPNSLQPLSLSDRAGRLYV